jgi:hypothetical protein
MLRSHFIDGCAERAESEEGGVAVVNRDQAYALELRSCGDAARLVLGQQLRRRNSSSLILPLRIFAWSLTAFPYCRSSALVGQNGVAFALKTRTAPILGIMDWIAARYFW